MLLRYVNPSSQDSNTSTNGGLDRTYPEKSQDADKARIVHRGPCQAFDQLSIRFGPRLFDMIPSIWQSMAGGLLSACQAGRRFIKFFYSVIIMRRRSVGTPHIMLLQRCTVLPSASTVKCSLSKVSDTFYFGY